MSRPDLYDLLWRHVPRENIRLGKRVLSYVEEETSITVNCSDNSAFCGDILVGADGAYSAVRQHLYKNLKIDKKLPSRDDVNLPFGCVCLVGQTTVLDPEDFPDLKSEKSHFTSILGLESLCTVRILLSSLKAFMSRMLSTVSQARYFNLGLVVCSGSRSPQRKTPCAGWSSSS